MSKDFAGFSHKIFEVGFPHKSTAPVDVRIKRCDLTIVFSLKTLAYPHHRGRSAGPAKLSYGIQQSNMLHIAREPRQHQLQQQRREHALLSRFASVSTAVSRFVPNNDFTERLPVFASAFSNSALHGNLLAAVSEDGYVGLLDTRFVGISASLSYCRPHASSIFDLQWSRDDSVLLTASSDKCAKITDVASGKCTLTFHSQSSSSGAIKAARFMPTGNDRVIACGTRDGSILLFDARCGDGAAAVQSARAARDERTPFVALSGAHDVSGKAATLRFGGLPASSSAGVVAAASSSKRSGKRAMRSEDGRSIASLGFSGHHLFTGGASDGTVKVWDVRKLVNSATAAAMQSTASASSGGGGKGKGKAASSSSGHGVTLSEGDGGCLFTLSQPAESGRSYGVSCLDVSPDGASLLVAYRSSRILTFDLATMLLGGGSAAGDDGARMVLPDAVMGTPPAAAATNDFSSAAASGLSLGSDQLTSAGGKRPRPPQTTPERRRSERLNEYVTPGNRLVRGSLAWTDVNVQSPGAPLLTSADAVEAVSLRFDEYGGHDGGSFYVRARFSRCGRYISSGSKDGRGYIWSADPRQRKLWLERAGETEAAAYDGQQPFPFVTDRPYSGAYASFHIEPLLILGDQQAGTGSVGDVNDVAWGGTPDGRDGLSDSLRIATCCDGGVVRLWAPFGQPADSIDDADSSYDLPAWLSRQRQRAAVSVVSWPFTNGITGLPTWSVFSTEGRSSRCYSGDATSLRPADSRHLHSASETFSPSSFQLSGLDDDDESGNDSDQVKHTSERRPNRDVGEDEDGAADTRIEWGFSVPRPTGSSSARHYSTGDQFLLQSQGVQLDHSLPGSAVQWALPYQLWVQHIRDRGVKELNEGDEREGLHQRGASADDAAIADEADDIGDLSQTSDIMSEGTGASADRIHMPAQRLRTRLLAHARLAALSASNDGPAAMLPSATNGSSRMDTNEALASHAPADERVDSDYESAGGASAMPASSSFFAYATPPRAKRGRFSGGDSSGGLSKAFDALSASAADAGEDLNALTCACASPRALKEEVEGSLRSSSTNDHVASNGMVNAQGGMAARVAQAIQAAASVAVAFTTSSIASDLASPSRHLLVLENLPPSALVVDSTAQKQGPGRSPVRLRTVSKTAPAGVAAATSSSGSAAAEGGGKKTLLQGWLSSA